MVIRTLSVDMYSVKQISSIEYWDKGIPKWLLAITESMVIQHVPGNQKCHCNNQLLANINCVHPDLSLEHYIFAPLIAN